MLNVSYPENISTAELSHAILFYEGNGFTTATVHKVKNHQLGAGKSVSPHDLEELFHAANQRQKMILLPPKIIAWSRNEVIWFEKSCIRPMFYNVPESSRKYLNEISGKNVIWPNLLFRIMRSTIYCWALAEDSRPDADTVLYRAPFTNIFNDGRFCPPNEFRDIRAEDMIEFARKAVEIFYCGHFSHLYSNMEKSLTYRRGRDRFWAGMAAKLEKGKCKKFPSKYLVPTNLTLKEILV